jgi:1,2-diacylglycerol 3-beta-galactosyltransferase
MRKILILFSDTGGGHRAAAEALCDALNFKYGDRYRTTLEDAIVNGAIWPFNNVPKTYLPITKYGAGAWGLGFDATNSPLGEHLLNALAYPIGVRGMQRIITRVDPDLLITVHPLITYAPWRVWKRLKPASPFVTLVTDLFDAHIMWFSAPSDLLVLPTEGARQHGIHWGFPPERMRVAGLPVSLKFTPANQPHVYGDPEALGELRARLGLVPTVFTILVVGGGEGMGPIDKITRALANSGLPIQLAVIAGRNAPLRRRLEAEHWAVPVRTTGFVTNMPDWMIASNLVVSKAGPGTIMEALAAGRPLLISSYLPGQEKGNVDFVEQSGVGVFRNTPEQIAEQVREWMIPGDNSLERMSALARAEARPEAATQIADLLDELLTRCYSA